MRVLPFFGWFVLMGLVPILMHTGHAMHIRMGRTKARRFGGLKGYGVLFPQWFTRSGNEDPVPELTVPIFFLVTTLGFITRSLVYLVGLERQPRGFILPLEGCCHDPDAGGACD
jgi:hypothetical protein